METTGKTMPQAIVIRHDSERHAIPQNAGKPSIANNPQQPASAVHVKGYIGANRDRWVKASTQKANAMFPLGDIIDNPKSVFKDLCSKGIMLITPKEQRAFVEQVAKIKDWDPIHIATRRGINGKSFILSQDFVVTAPSALRPRVFLHENSTKWATRGTLDEWQEVAKRLVGQHLPIFCVSLAFTPLLQPYVTGLDNFGIELVGDTGEGKTSFCRYTGATWGGDPTQKLGYMESWLTSANGFEGVMAEHNNCLLVLDESNLATDAHFETIFRLAEGVRKRRYGESTSSRTTQFVWLSSGNKPVLERLKGFSASELGAVASRVFTVPSKMSEKTACSHFCRMAFRTQARPLSFSARPALNSSERR